MLSIGALALAGCTWGGYDGSSSSASTAVIGPEGGSVSSIDGICTVEVPASAVEGPTTVSVSSVRTTPPPQGLVPKYGVHAEPPFVGAVAIWMRPQTGVGSPIDQVQLARASADTLVPVAVGGSRGGDAIAFFGVTKEAATFTLTQSGPATSSFAVCSADCGGLGQKCASCCPGGTCQPPCGNGCFPCGVDPYGFSDCLDGCSAAGGDVCSACMRSCCRVAGGSAVSPQNAPQASCQCTGYATDNEPALVGCLEGCVNEEPLPTCKSGDPSGSTSKTIGPEGGSVGTSDGVFRIDVPPGALARPTILTVGPTMPPIMGTAGPAYALTAEGSPFVKSVAVWLRPNMGPPVNADTQLATVSSSEPAKPVAVGGSSPSGYFGIVRDQGSFVTYGGSHDYPWAACTGPNCGPTLNTKCPSCCVNNNCNPCGGPGCLPCMTDPYAFADCLDACATPPPKICAKCMRDCCNAAGGTLASPIMNQVPGCQCVLGGSMEEAALVSCLGACVDGESPPAPSCAGG
jgi:hypothetical protein